MKRLLTSATLAGALACSPGAGTIDAGVTTCVARGTLVRTPRGARRIEGIVEGDEVCCIDPLTREVAVAKVTAVRSAKRECVRVVLAHGELVLTSDHPVYCPDTKEWAPAGDWALGKRARLLRATEEAMEAVEVLGRELFAGVFDVFDLTVDHPLHNFVANGVLVHNKPGRFPRCILSDAGTALHGDACTCADGTSGVLQCYDDPHAPDCAGCPDAGVPDAGAAADGG